jgi:hypothetical protein
VDSACVAARTEILPLQISPDFWAASLLHGCLMVIVVSVFFSRLVNLYLLSHLQVSLKSAPLPCGPGKTAAARTLNLSYAFGPIRASLIDGAKLRQLHCGFRIFVRLF